MTMSSDETGRDEPRDATDNAPSDNGEHTGEPKKKRRRRRRGGRGRSGAGNAGAEGGSDNSDHADAEGEHAPQARATSDADDAPRAEGADNTEGGEKKRRRRRRGGKGRSGAGSGAEGAGGEEQRENADAGSRSDSRPRRESDSRGGGSGGGRSRRAGGRRDDHDDTRPRGYDEDGGEEEVADLRAGGPKQKRDGFDAESERMAGIFDTTVTFADLGLSDDVMRGLNEAGWKHPTTIQAQLIPALLNGKDMLGQAKTGTGKTAAFGLPLLSALEPGENIRALILVPTRELAIQVCSEINELGHFTSIRAVPVYGGQKIPIQVERIRKGAEIIVATPGRAMDLHNRRVLPYDNVRHVVLDEVDRMLDIGFRDDIKKILKDCPRTRQTAFVSATISDDIEKLARQFCKDDIQKIVTAAGSLTVELVTQHHLPVDGWDKLRLLRHLLTHEEPELTVVFCKMKRTVDKVVDRLRERGIDAQAIHGDMYQAKRDKVMKNLRGGKLSVLVASDLAARGLDVDGITHVVNYDLPDDPEVYVHRIGRTARAGREGVAWTFVTPEEGPKLTEIEVLINREVPKMEYPDFKPSPPPSGVLEQREEKRKRDEQASKYNRLSMSSTPSLPRNVDLSKFPGGIVPTKLPPKSMGGRVKTSRSMKKVIAEDIRANEEAKKTD